MEEIKKLKETEVNLLIVGATGVGKSSTISALFNTDSCREKEVAPIGHNVQPKTKHLNKYCLGKLNTWDTPGLGDGIDDKYIEFEIEELLHQKTEDNYGLIDLVIVILDGSNKDLGTSIDIINKILILNLGEKPEERILIAINKIDLAKSGRYWDRDQNKPMDHLEKYLDQMINDIKSRIHQATNVSIDPIIYSAGDIKNNQSPYNLLEFINNILVNLPDKKRIIIAEVSNQNKKNWKNNKNTKEAESTTRKIFREILRTGILAGVSSLFGGMLLFEI